MTTIPKTISQTISGKSLAAATFMSTIPLESVASPDAVSMQDLLVEAQLVEDIGAAERLDAADRLRTLSHEIPAVACHLHGNINVDESKAMLTEAYGEFTQLTDALLNGAPDMNIIGAETRRKTIVEITELQSAWAPTGEAVLSLLESADDLDALETIKAAHQDMFDKTSYLLSELTGEYANPAELLLADALLIDAAGRQSMLTQKLSKEVCAIWTGDRSEEALAALQGTMAMYAFTQAALYDGDPNLGVKAAPTPEIKAGLADVMADWEELSQELNYVMTHEDVSDELKGAIYASLNAKMYQMDKIVHLYTVYAKYKYD